MILISVAVFILLLIGVGLYVSKKVQGDSTNYIVAGRGLILPLAAATLMAQAVDTNATLGDTDLTAEFGFWAGAALPIGLALALFLTGLFFAKPLNRMNLMTLPDFYRRKYGRPVELIASIIMVLSFSILLAGNMVAAGFLFEVFLGTSYLVEVFIIARILLLYTMPAGLLIPLVMGLFWSKANTPSALAAIIFGSGTRLVLFALTPTVYGVDNTLLYIPNDFISASFDGLPTLISPLVGLGVFVLMALLIQDTYAPAALDRTGQPVAALAGSKS